MRPIRRTQAERSEKMRQHLAKSAYEVIAGRGHSAFRTAALVAHAGVSQGALLHHFPTKDAITLAAIDYALEVAEQASSQRIAAAAGRSTGEVLTALFEDLRDFFFGSAFWVALGITMDVARDTVLAPALREIVGSKRQPVYDGWADALVASGWAAPRATDAVIMTAALISGYGVRTLWIDDGDALGDALGTWQTFLLQANK